MYSCVPCAAVPQLQRWTALLLPARMGDVLFNRRTSKGDMVWLPASQQHPQLQLVNPQFTKHRTAETAERVSDDGCLAGCPKWLSQVHHPTSPTEAIKHSTVMAGAT